MGQLAGQALAALAVAVAPDHMHAEIRRGMGIPAIGGLEADLIRRQPQPVQSILIDTPVGLVGAQRIDREYFVKQPLQPGAGDGGIEHRRGAVGKDGGFQSGLAQGAEHEVETDTARKGVMSQMQLHLVNIAARECHGGECQPQGRPCAGEVYIKQRC